MRDLCLRIVAILAVLVGLLTLGRGQADLAGGTQITNFATATFEDAAGNAYQTQSTTVVATIAKVAGIAVSPKETTANPATDGAALNSTTTRTFTIANTSNIADAYKITAAQVAPLSIVSMSYVTNSRLIPVTINGTVSPTVQPGGVITLQVVLSTANLAMGAKVSVSITAETTADSDNGPQSDSGEQWVIGASSSAISGPGGSGTTISKTVNDATIVQSSTNAPVTYNIVAKNSGGTPATNVVVTDPLPPGFTADLSSVTINGTPASAQASLSNGVLTVQCGTLNAGASVNVGFSASTPDVKTLGSTYVNTAQVSADGMAPAGTTPASVLLGTANIVYDGYGGGGAPVSGATVRLLDANGNLVKLGSSSSSSTQSRAAQDLGIASSDNTTNPLVTGANGTYGFALAPSQVAPGGSTFILELNAPGYLNRKIQLTLTPSSDGMLYDVTSVALDGQPVAQAGGFTLVKAQVQLQNVFGLFGNVPLFATRAIAVTKTADRSTAQPGDRVRYEIDFSNSTTDAIGGTQVIDTMPPGIVYAPGTGTLDGVATEPQIDGQTLTWSLPELDGGQQHKITYDGVVYPTAAAGEQLTNSVTVTGQIPGTKVSASGASSVTVQVVAGAITQRRPILGRVFLDTAGTGHFHKGDKGVAGVRVYLEDGSSVVTDAEGRFNFPSARPGMHVLRLDATTLPSGVHPYPDQRMNSTHALQQLVHGILDDGIVDDVEFALEP